ncbi:hypothetical protein PoB_006392000 [Plakobranchus ocellatus]|uniref:Uncharacterized protein n=1 Tax=Plakobranchus ocellatus TaxID=259542 RepID=A0AAV4D028_9GAST|nr:hypothetical protein PoB_006392000 [Plakobranchus ocellatus]
MNRHCLVLAFLTFLARDIKGVPRITSFKKVATLNEGALTNEVLSTIVCTSDPAGDPTRTYVRNIQPGSPCANCFTILDCGGEIGMLRGQTSSMVVLLNLGEELSKEVEEQVENGDRMSRLGVGHTLLTQSCLLKN